MQSKARRKIAVSRGFGIEIERWPDDMKEKKVLFMGGFGFRNVVIAACRHHTQTLVCHSRRISLLSAVNAVFAVDTRRHFLLDVVEVLLVLILVLAPVDRTKLEVAQALLAADAGGAAAAGDALRHGLLAGRVALRGGRGKREEGHRGTLKRADVLHGGGRRHGDDDSLLRWCFAGEFARNFQG